MMKTDRAMFGLLVALALGAVTAWADQLERMDVREARKLAKQLCLEARKLNNLPVQVVPDVSQAEGIRRADDVGIVLVPQQDLQEGGFAPQAVQKETGAPLGFLFTYQVVPVIHAALVDTKELHRLTLTNEAGEKLQVSCLLLTVRQRTDSDWRLYAYGVGRRPLVDVPFERKAGPGRQPLALECTDLEGVEGNLVVTLFDRSQARFRVGYQPE